MTTQHNPPNALPGSCPAAPRIQTQGLDGSWLLQYSRGAGQARKNGYSDMPAFGATFQPGGGDDFYMPEVIAPSPQRVMPEVPQNMQQGLQRMELEARSVGSGRHSSQTSPTFGVHQRGRDSSMAAVVNANVGGYGQQYQQPKPGHPATNYSPASGYSPFQDSGKNTPAFDKKDMPSFSPFPQVKGEHIPPSDEEKEAVLAESREYVLHSNDPNMQICWARDVLSYVEIAAENALREAEAARSPHDRDFERPVTPKIEHELRIDATNIVTYLADQGHPEAVFIRAKWTEFGKFGQYQDKKEAYNGYVSAGEQGWGRAQYRIGMLFENSNTFDKAFWHYEQGLALGDSAASYRLGMISLMGQHGQPKYVARGLELIHSAADTADEDAPQGAFVYGMIIARDLPDVDIPESVLAQDIGVARQYIEKAAYLGFAKAQLKMGQAYELCQLGCDFKPDLSLHYYGLAAKQGQPEASLGVSRWFLFGYEGSFAKNESLAFKYANLAAKQKLPTGEFAMGYYYEIGICVEKDLREAKRWYELAAEHGNKDAVGRLDGLAHAKSLSKTDHETTTLTRIKSQHGSQRGKRPDRFKQQKNPMPTLSEGGSPRVSPRVSPMPSPRGRGVDMSDPTRANPGGNRPPAFTVNLAERPKSAAPYPEDDRPAPLNLARSRSTAPYPEDDTAGRPPKLAAGHFNANIRPSADRPNSSFSIRSQSPARHGPPGPAMRQSQSTGQIGGNLAIPQTGMDPNRGRPVSASAGWHQQVPGGHPQDYRPSSAQYGQRPAYDQRLAGPGGPAPNKTGQNRLRKENPNPLPVKQMPPPGQFPMGGGYGAPVPSPANAGRDYGTRNSSRPSSGGRTSGAPMGSPTMSGGLGGPGPGPRTDSMNSMGSMGSGPRSGSVRPGPGTAQERPMDYGPEGRRASAPPAKMASPAPSVTSAAGSTMSATQPASTKPAKQPSNGPSTFEEMGIPQGKNEEQCLVM